MNAQRTGRPPSPNNWFLLLHGLLGASLGFSLSILLSGCMLHYLWGQSRDPAHYQLAMWAVPVLWIGIISVSFLARNTKSCLKWLVFANVAAAALLYPTLR